MRVLKFGGSSVSDAKRISNVINILKGYEHKGEKYAVVFSAFQGVTDKLIELGNLALKQSDDYKKELSVLRSRHKRIINELVPKKNQSIHSKVKKILDELSEVLHGVNLIKELSPRSLDLIMSFGEILSCTVISEALKRNGVPCEFLDMTKIIKTDDCFGGARVDFTATNENIVRHFRRHKKTQIVTGFIGSTNGNVTTTIGRGGSDYTASIIGAALNASEIEIWTDVDGILTADPRKVKESFPLKAVTYEEAMELSHFGAKVIHPPTMLPALHKKIKIRIKNTFNPEARGTVILERQKSIAFNVKGISSIDEISLIRVQGGGMVGVTGIASRLFGALARKGINIILISQASSEHSICFAISPLHGADAKKAIEEEFKLEMLEGRIGKVIVEDNLSIIAVVGEDMKQTPGISGEVFEALGKNGINIHAIAQGSSELNISLVINRSSLTKALNVLHDSLFISKYKTINLFMAGPGLVGSELLKLIENRLEFINKEIHTKIEIKALADSKYMLFSRNGIRPDNWKSALKKSGVKSDPYKFVKYMKEMDLPNSIFVDCTAAKSYVPYYKEILDSSISVVTPNKIANSGPYKKFIELQDMAKRRNVQFRYGTNVGAALPIINNLRDLINNGDEIIKIEGVLSGTLSYIFNSLQPGENFSQIVKKAQELGYTEPDPRDDLSGLDVARKLLILIRESKISFEMKQVKVENLVPSSARKAKNVKVFFNELAKHDSRFAKKVDAAVKKGMKLCYIAKYERGKAKVGIETIGKDHPFYNLAGTDNIVAFTTKNYSQKPLVIRGPGAGADYTAFGVFVDIMRISNYLS